MRKVPKRVDVELPAPKVALKFTPADDEDPPVQLAFPNPIFGEKSYNPNLYATVIYRHALDFRNQLVIGDTVAWIESTSRIERTGKLVEITDERGMVTVLPEDSTTTLRLLMPRILRAIR